jgi:hypothetical protein
MELRSPRNAELRQRKVCRLVLHSANSACSAVNLLVGKGELTAEIAESAEVRRKKPVDLQIDLCDLQVL